MLSILVALTLTADVPVNGPAYIQMVPGEQLTHVLVINQGEGNLSIVASLSTNSLEGTLSFNFSKEGRKFKKQLDGYPTTHSSSTVEVRPGFVYGVSLPTVYLQQMYGLESGCYDVLIELRLPPQERKNERSKIVSRQQGVCFAFEHKGSDA